MFSPNFERPSAQQEVIDPIYNNKDPIAVSVETRKKEGSILTVVRGKGERL